MPKFKTSPGTRCDCQPAAKKVGEDRSKQPANGLIKCDQPHARRLTSLKARRQQSTGWSSRIARWSVLRRWNRWAQRFANTWITAAIQLVLLVLLVALLVPSAIVPEARNAVLDAHHALPLTTLWTDAQSDAGYPTAKCIRFEGSLAGSADYKLSRNFMANRSIS